MTGRLSKAHMFVLPHCPQYLFTRAKTPPILHMLGESYLLQSVTLRQKRPHILRICKVIWVAFEEAFYGTRTAPVVQGFAKGCVRFSAIPV